jgi:uncharacterized membrane protein
MTVTTRPDARPPAERARRRSSRRAGLRKGLLTVHIVSAVGLLGSIAGLLVAGIRAATRDDLAEAHTIYELMAVLPFALGIPLSFIALGSGILVALTSPWGLFRHWWVTAKLALLVATLSLGAVVSGPAMTEMADHTAPSGDGDRGDEWALVFVLGVQIGLVLAAAVLAVFKPGGRIPWRRARAGA